MSTGDFPESLSQAILVGIMLVGRLGVCVLLLLRVWDATGSAIIIIIIIISSSSSSIIVCATISK